VQVAWDADLPLVKRLLAEAALACPLLDPARTPVVQVKRFGDGSVELAVAFWVRDYLDQGAARSEVLEQVHRRLSEAGIALPLPSRRIIQQAAVPEA
jgi:small-conductance mechanosensitive channel